MTTIGWTTGYSEGYWGNWPWTKMYGGSEAIVVEVSKALAAQGHSVTVRLPYKTDERVWQGVRWLGMDAPEQRYELLLCADDYHRRDRGLRNVLVACRSDPPPHTDFDELAFLSNHHSVAMGHPGRPFVGGGVNLADYETAKVRIPHRVICTSSPDRCPDVGRICKTFNFRHAYKPVPGFNTTMYERPELIRLQQEAMVMAYPLSPRRPSDFWSLACAESCAAGTPFIISNADALPEVWGDVAYAVLPRPIDYGEWYDTINEAMSNKGKWARTARLAKLKALDLSWDKVAARYLRVALS